MVLIEGIDLFCGVGGLTYGLEKAGIDVKLGVDLDPDSRHPIESNTKAKFLQADVAELNPEDLSGVYTKGAVRLLAGCAPCQPFSTYSRKAKREVEPKSGQGKKDDWKLVSKFADLVEKVSPELVTMENVPPLADQEVFKYLLRKLEGYWVEWKIVECEKIGLAQSRKRLVLLASRLGEVQIVDFIGRKKTVRDVIGKLPRLTAGEIDSKDTLHRSSRLSETNMKRIKASRPGGTWRDWPEDLRAECHLRDSGTTYPSVYGRMEWDAPSPTITTQCFGYGNGRFGHPEQDRAISLREAAMLQGFPENYSFLSEEKDVSFSKLGRLIGNAVPVDLSLSIGKNIIDHVSKYRN